MISERYANEYCKDDISLIENYELAVNDTKQIWHCHHRGEILPCGVYSPKDLRKFGLYYNRPACELIFMTRTEHTKLHCDHPLKNTRENRSKAMFGNHNKPTKPIFQYSKDGVFIKKWTSSIEASKVLGIAQGHISECCKGTRKSAGGFVWRYADDKLIKVSSAWL